MTVSPPPPRRFLSAALLCAMLGLLCVAAPAAAQEEAPPAVTLGLPVDELLRLYLKKYEWVNAEAGITQPDLTAAAISPVDARQLYIGGSGQVFRSRDDGLTWDNPLSVQGLDQTADNASRTGTQGPSQGSVNARRQELIDERAQARFQELREEFTSDLESEGTDSDFADELAEEVEDELLDQARDEILANDLPLIEAQLRAEGNRASGVETNALGEAETAEDSAPSGALLLANGIRRLEAHPVFPGVALAATGSGLYQTVNFGSTWELIFNGLGGDSRFTTSAVMLGAQIFVGTEEGMYLSTDGQAWDRFPGRQGNLTIFDLASAPPKTLGALTREGLFMSVDGGATFTRTTLPVEVDEADLNALSISPNDPRRIAIATSRGVYVSEDGGATITRATTVGLPSLLVQDVAWHPASPGVLIAATDRGVFLNPDGTEWGELYAGLGNSDVRQIAIASQAPWSILASTAAGPYIYTPQGRLEARRDAIRKLQELWDKEPSLASVMVAAMRFNFLEQDRLESLETRARWSALLPRIRGRGNFYVQRLERDQLLVTEPDLFITRTRSLTLPNQDQWQVLATWDINELIFSPQEIPAKSAVQQLQSQRRKLLTQLVRLYQRRRNLQQRQALRADGDGPQHVKEALDIDLLTAQLDALTDSFFTRYSSLRRKP